jgi:uncharacterized protein YgiM (DUF1202 family)
MITMKKRALLFLAVSLFASSAYAAETRYIHGGKAKLLSEPAYSSEAIANVERGAQVIVLEERKKWLKVRYEDKEGWLPTLLVKENPPLEKASLLQKEDIDLSENARRRASANTSTAAARGLREDGRARESDDTNADFHALSDMEANSVSDKEAADFIKQELE